MTDISIRPATSSEQTQALSLLFAEFDPDEVQERIDEMLASAGRGEISLAGLLLAERAGETVGAGLFTPQPGRVGFVWLPGVPRDQPNRAEIQSAILKDIGRRLDDLGLCLGQAILDPGDSANRKVLEENGFWHLTDLHYMLWPVDSARPPEFPQHFETETYHAATNSERFVQVLERTYIQTLDCPELEGLRTAEDALASHRATGRFDAARWELVLHNGQDAGLLLVNEHPECDLLEIVYLGVVPEARGQGLGAFFVQRAIARARQEGRALVLAVDERNVVARQLYTRFGFLDLSVQSVHVRQAATTDPVLQSTNYAQPRGIGKIIS